MFSVFVKTIITFLVVYAVIDIVIRLINTTVFSTPHGDEDVFVILRVRNQEEQLEGIVRTIIWKNLNLTNGGYIPNIVIVDMGSDDCTRLIGERLSEDYSFIYYTTYEEYESFKDTFMF